MSYIGQQLPADVFSGFVTDSFTGDGSATTFTLSKAPFSEDALIVVINNVIQKPVTNFTVSGTTLTIVGTAVASGDVIYAMHTSGAVPSTLASKVDVNGLSDGVILDADADTTISADTDDQIDIKIGGTDALRVTGTALTGNAVATIGAAGTASSLAGIPFFQGDTGSIYTHDVSGTDSTAQYNTAYGLTALDAITTGDYNVAIGYNAGSDTTSGERNVFIGNDAGKDCIGGGQNVAIGDNAGSGALSTAAGRSVMIGRNSGQAMTSASENILIGFEAGKNLTIGGNNVVMGYTAFEDAVVERQCVAIGNYALANHRTSSSTVNDTGNTAVGYAAGDAITTGGGNVMIGAVVDPSGANGENQIVIGNTFSGNGDNKVNFGSGLGYIWNSYTQNATWTQVSDERTKKNIETDTLGLDFINELRPVTFNWRKNEELDSTFKESLLNKHIDKDDSATIHGLIAQEVKAAMDKVGNSTFNGWEDTVDGQAVSREMFITPLIKAVQELSAKVTTLETEVDTLETKVKALEDA